MTPPSTHPSRLQFAGSTATASTHTHFGLLYESRAEQLAVATSFVEEGLERGERCIYAAAENTEREIWDALRAAGVDVADAVDSGDLRICDAHELYLEDGGFSLEAMVSRLEEMVGEVTGQAGYAGLRVTAELTWVREMEDDRDLFLEYEAEVNRVYPDLELVGLCQYDRTRLPPDTVDRIIRAHPILAVEETTTTNPYYLDPDADHTQPLAHDPDRKLDTLGALQRRERGMTVLTEGTPQLMQDDREEIPEVVVATLRDAVSLPVAGLWLYDRGVDELRLRAATGPASTDADAAMAACTELAWHAFRTDETQTWTDLREAQTRVDLHEGPTSSEEPSLESALFVPINGYGVLGVAAPTPDAVDAPAVRVAEAVAANTDAALARAEHERRLESHRDELTQYTTATRLFQEICRTAVDAATRADIEAAVCEQLTAFGDICFAWIGARSADDDEMTPRAWAGAERGYLSDVPLHAGAAAPAVRAAATGEPVAVVNIVDRVEANQWRTAALSRDFRSVIGIPLAYNDISYGTLTVYAAESAVFDELLEAVLTALGQLVAYAIHFAERTTALREHTTQELEFEITASNFPMLQLTRHANCTLAVESSPSTDGDRPLLFATVEGASRDEIVEAVDAALTVESVEFVRETPDAHHVHLTLSERFVGAALADRGAMLRTVTADPSRARIVVHAPTTVATQTISETIDGHYPGATLVAKRQHDRSLTATTDLQTRLLDRLTERQLEVLTTAYHAGYFESPRKSTGKEVADVLDITSQTFSQHLRRIQRELFEVLLTGGSIDGPG